MKVRGKRFIALMLVISMILPFNLIDVYAATDNEQKSANILYSLGLSQGVGTNADGTVNFDLDRAPSRSEAVTMLVRLLGKETEAVNGTWDIPFTDVEDWARPYVGYAYANALTSGVSATEFGSLVNVSIDQYITFLLRALGYNSSDFNWEDSWSYAENIGINTSWGGNRSNFTRGHAFCLSNAFLLAPLKNSTTTLLEKIGVSYSQLEFASGFTYRIEGTTLYLSGSGKIPDVPGVWPWRFYRNFITKIVIADGIENVPMGAFSDMEALTEVVLPDSLKTIEDSAFHNCKKLDNVTLPDGLKEIGELSFAYANMTQIVIPASVIRIDVGAFFLCQNLKAIYFEGNRPTINYTTYETSQPLDFKTLGEAVVYYLEGCEGFGQYIFPNNAVKVYQKGDFSHEEINYPMYAEFPLVPDFGAIFNVEKRVISNPWGHDDPFSDSLKTYSYNLQDCPTGSMEDYINILKECGFNLESRTNHEGKISTFYVKYDNGYRYPVSVDAYRILDDYVFSIVVQKAKN